MVAGSGDVVDEVAVSAADIAGGKDTTQQKVQAAVLACVRHLLY